jgi:hypothetical protein
MGARQGERGSAGAKIGCEFWPEQPQTLAQPSGGFTPGGHGV